jgi:hypothetical protein
VGNSVLCQQTEGQEDWQSQGRPYWMKLTGVVVHLAEHDLVAGDKVL